MPEAFVFDLEKQLLDAKTHAVLHEKVQSRIHLIKELLQSGIDKEDFDFVGRILYGYSSLVKVMGRFRAK